MSGISGVNEGDGSSSTGAGSGGHTLYATGADTMATLGFLPSGSNQFTWGESDSESVTTTESDSDTEIGGGDGETDSATEYDTQSESESNGETGSENYSDSEGSLFRLDRDRRLRRQRPGRQVPTKGAKPTARRTTTPTAATPSDGSRATRPPTATMTAATSLRP